MISFDPVYELSFFGLSIYTHMFAILIGFFFAGVLFWKQMKKFPLEHFHNQPAKRNIGHTSLFLIIMACSIIGGILIARLFFYAGPWGHDVSLWDFFSPQGGLVWYGGFIGAWVYAAVAIKLLKLNFWRLADCIAPSIALGSFLARIGCFLVYDAPGTATALPWAINIGGGSLHPVALYLSMANLCLFILLINLKVYKERYKLWDGFLFLFYLIGYASLRFVVEFFRVYDGSYAGFSLSQYVSIFLFLVAGAGILLKHTDTYEKFWASFLGIKN